MISRLQKLGRKFVKNFFNSINIYGGVKDEKGKMIKTKCCDISEKAEVGIWTNHKYCKGKGTGSYTVIPLHRNEFHSNSAFIQFSLVAQSCPTLCDPMNRSTPGLPVHHQLPEFTQTRVHRVSDAIQPSHPLSFPSPIAPNPSQHQSLFQ